MCRRSAGLSRPSWAGRLVTSFALANQAFGTGADGVMAAIEVDREGLAHGDLQCRGHGRLTANGNDTGECEVAAKLSLLDFLHDEMGLTGSKFSCGIAVCRACTVTVRQPPEAPSNPVVSCSTPVASVHGYHVETVEGLAATGLSPLQRAFLDHFAFQCGYCTPGFVMAATVLLQRLQHSPVPEAEIDDAMDPRQRDDQ